MFLALKLFDVYTAHTLCVCLSVLSLCMDWMDDYWDGNGCGVVRDTLCAHVCCGMCVCLEGAVCVSMCVCICACVCMCVCA